MSLSSEIAEAVAVARGNGRVVDPVLEELILQVAAKIDAALAPAAPVAPALVPSVGSTGAAV